jgi:rRNA maturation endonuclease Nob1
MNEGDRRDNIWETTRPAYQTVEEARDSINSITAMLSEVRMEIKTAQKEYIVEVAKRLKDNYNMEMIDVATVLGVWQNTLETWLSEDEEQ